MPFGILQCKKMRVVPGTGKYEAFQSEMRVATTEQTWQPAPFTNDRDDLPLEYSSIPRELLDHGKGIYKDVILVPQPSNSPNDPLNWPQRKKDTSLLIVGLSVGVVGAYGPMLSPGFVQVSSDLGSQLRCSQKPQVG